MNSKNQGVRHAILAVVLIALNLTNTMAQQEIGYIEEFALAADRTEALEQLIPGTEDYYYFHALHYQNTGHRAELNDMLGQWKKRFRDSKRRKQIVHRQALIDYGTDPKKSLEYIRRELGLSFNHQQEGKARAKVYPAMLKQDQVSWAKFLADALRGTDGLDRLDSDAFFPLLQTKHKLTVKERRDLLSRAALPDLPGLVKLIAADLATKESRGFGEFNIHQMLTIAQLDELLGLKKDLIRNEQFVHTYLAKLRPGADENPVADPAVREAYLDRAWVFVKGLEPSFNSLKAHVLYQRLVHDRSVGQCNAARFMEYVKLPRNSPCIRPEWRKEDVEVWRHAADCNRDYRKVTGLPPIGGDEPLVRDYLLVLLKDAKDFKAYAPYLAESWLKGVFAETKIVNGVGDPERWASLLSPSAFQALKDRVDVEFDPVHNAAPDAKGKVTNAEEFGVDDPVRLRLHVKNVETLIVKVFEVNTLNYYLEHGEEVSTDLKLDGLVANHERTVKYDDPPVRRIARDFEFPEIENRRGVWVVEFIGGSRSSRAVIRKGKLEMLARTVSAGVGVTVLNEAHQPVRNAAVWVGERRFAGDEQGRVLIPFSTNPGGRKLVLEDANGFSALASTRHPGEDYRLQAGIWVDREALRPGALATIAVRPTLTVAGQPISLKRLDEVRLVLRSVDLDGVTTTTTIPDFAIASDREATHEFRVPDRLAGLNVQLRAKVKVASKGGQEIELSDQANLEVNEQLRSDRVEDLFLSRIGGGYVLELFGRTGEPWTGRNINVVARREGFKNTREFTLKTDKAGGIELGALEGIETISAETPSGLRRTWQMSEARRTQDSVIHAVAGEAVQVPFFGKLSRAKVALLAVSSGGYTVDEFKKLTFKGGFLVAADLPAGDHRLLLKQSGEAVMIRVAAGESAAGHVFNEARTLQLDKRPPAHLAAAKAGDKELTIDVANADSLTRVHVVATRFLPDHDVFAALGYAPRAGLYQGNPGRLPNLFLSGRKIGDEFRYILERRYARKLPGNQLERPEILLNPWAVRDTEAGEEQLAEGEAYDREMPGEAAAGAVARNGKKGGGKKGGGDSRSLDFLQSSPAVLLNLQPDKKGRISIKLDALGDRQHVHILVVDPDGASYLELALPDSGTAIRDLRLANALDPKRHFTEQDAVTLLKAGEKLELPDLLTARFETFDHLGAAYRYLLAVRDDPTLREFGFIVGWPELEADKKRDLYSKYACHELSFFLAMKDPEFFKAVVVPHLANKKDRTFLDDYLLDRKLGGYFAPYEYGRLNVPERILLARRSPGRIGGVRLDLGDRISLTPPDLGRETYLFESALSSFGLSGSRHAVVDEAKMKLAELQLSDGKGNLAAGSAGDRLESLARRATPGAVMEEAEAVTMELAKQVEDLTVLKDRAQKSRKRAGRAYDKLSLKAADDAFGDVDFDLGELDGEVLYRAIETTKEWAENNYYHLPIESHTHDLIRENKFWRDFANHDGEAGFGSRHIGDAASSFHEAMLALAVLDLPFKAPEHKTEIDGAQMTFTAGGRVLAFHREIKEAGMAEDGAPLLVSQAYFRKDDRHRIEDGEQVDKFVTDEFVAGVVYGGQIVVTNPTSSRQKLDVLVQIPKGAIPVQGDRATATRRIAMEPYTTQRHEVFFYFPATGDYPCYPAHVSKTGKVIALAKPFTFKVVDKLSKVDETSWAYISQWGTEEQVLAYLAKQNLHAVNLNAIAWRCRESREFFEKALAALDLRGLYDGTLWSYGIQHNVAPAARQFLLMQGGFLNSCGYYLASELITIDPIERRAYQHLEYKPLVNARAHEVGGERKILNARIRGQYQQFMRILSQKPAFDDEDQLSIAYYLFLQDRAHEAMERLAAVKPKNLPTRIQFDYFQAYASFYRADPAAARKIAARYSDYPVDRWREKFAAVVAQADEIEGKAPVVVDDQSRDQQQAEQAAKETALELEVEGSEVTLSYRNLASVTVNYYEMDLEFLFSTNPFVSSGGGGFSIVRPNRTAQVKLPKGKVEHQFALPAEYQAKNVLVEVIGGGKKRSKAVYANELRTALSENFGILSVRHAKDDRPLPKVYVKVYAMTGGGAKFYKDGYTDLRGKFDYASVSTSDIGNASKFSILVMSEEHGATVLEAPVPQR